ncbi:MAG: CsbD family protein [Chloroflexi bacterium]|nr:MAG: CsbD family protein [Chloroflexota bacterium]
MKDRLKGKIEELKGKATGSRTDQARGKLRQVVGDAKSAAKEIQYDSEHRDRERPPQ